MKEVKKVLAKALGSEVQVLVDKVVPESQYGGGHLEGILVNNGYALGTDARFLLQVPLAKALEEDVPKNVLRGEAIKKSVWISKTGLQKAFKNIYAKAVLPILTNIFLRQTKTETLMLTTDLEHTIEIREERKTAEEHLKEFPDTSGLSKLKKPVYAVEIGAGYLKTLAEIALKLKETRIRFISQENESEEGGGIAFYFKTENGMSKGILMPLQKEQSLKDCVAEFESISFIKK